ncbi:hypothetical protein [Dactylosporangium sp. NPDC000521]|uniref:GntT/GntP/DsdX family permease n=1 Tax=Dactylosporangium sp. NPDC000521 TaxID=3363975 RepID=UPI0036AD8FA1
MEPSALGAVGDDLDGPEDERPASRPGFVLTLATILLPVALMLGRAIAGITLDKGHRLRTVLDVLGDPFVALLLAVLVALITFGHLRGFSRQKVSDLVAGLMAPLLAQLSGTDTALLALAIGSGSLFLSHVNDAGFWLVKEYFGMTVGGDVQDLVGDGDDHLRGLDRADHGPGSRGVTLKSLT